MNGSSKILTVSYGTFSCTLEGFDDPLGTMRELAEYFRDLAADDRYFGAEPPTPDVEMLQNIAQREVRRKVEARTSPTGIALTQVAEPKAPAAQEEAPSDESVPAAADAQEPLAADTGPLTFDDDFLMADEPEDVLAIDPDAAPSIEGPAETVAEKLRRIRAVVSRRPDSSEAANTPAQDPSAEGKRDRAMTETIRQIQSDLSDDEDAEEEDQGSHQFEVGQEDSALPKAETVATADEQQKPVEEPIAADDAQTKAAEDTFEEDEAKAPVADDAHEDNAPSVSQFLENVTEKIGEIQEEPDATPAATKPLGDTKTDADVGRLLEETDNKLNEDGVVRRRQVISQMRAAVAATKADRAVTRLISPEAQDEVEKKAYRNDLSDAVGNTKPLPKQAPDQKSSSPPLVLVSSQRVSEEAGAHETKTDQPTPDNFAQFVKLNEAKGLEELLEAAAAYTIFSKGQESFSRPEIMKRVAMVDPALSLTREDGLRSFGQLLREGKFQKLDRGQFTIDQDTRFNPGKRIAGE